MREENDPAGEPAGMVRPCSAWFIGILYGFTVVIVPLARMIGGAASLPEWLEDVPVGILDVALGYYWAVILRQVTRNEKIDPTVFAVFFGLCFAADLAVDVVQESVRSIALVVLERVISVVFLAGIWYMVVRLWNAAAGRNAPFTAKLALGYLTLFSMLVLDSFRNLSSRTVEWDPGRITLLFLVVVLLYAGLQHLFNLGLRSSRIPETPEDCRCPLWKAVLQGVAVALGILAAIALVFIVIAVARGIANGIRSAL